MAHIAAGILWQQLDFGEFYTRSVAAGGVEQP